MYYWGAKSNYKMKESVANFKIGTANTHNRSFDEMQLNEIINCGNASH